jgi:hypothetical protein
MYGARGAGPAMSEVLGWVALLLLVAGGFYGVMQSYRQDLDRLPRILSRLLVLPAAVVISHVFPWAISIPALWCLSRISMYRAAMEAPHGLAADDFANETPDTRWQPDRP